MRAAAAGSPGFGDDRAASRGPPFSGWKKNIKMLQFLIF
jgi:hypothetical protein